MRNAGYVLNNKDEAIAWLKKAQENYLLLGDRSQVQELEKRALLIMGIISPP